MSMLPTQDFPDISVWPDGAEDAIVSDFSKLSLNDFYLTNLPTY